ncbi:hypothetical protein ACFL5B_01465 [Candidatus Latescibacterota bacterium]
MLFAGCSILRKEQKQGIVGTWTGKGIYVKDSDVTMTFSEDMTMTLTYDMGDKIYILNGNYTANLSKNPALIDIFNFGFSKSETSICCMAIAEFPIMNKMNIYGLIGQCGEISRPTEFNRNPSDRHQLYLELMKK